MNYILPPCCPKLNCTIYNVTRETGSKNCTIYDVTKEMGSKNITQQLCKSET